jgi:hypothetical protein
MQYTGEKPVDPLSVHIHSFGAAELADGGRTNAFALYEDDGTSNNYQNGEFQRTDLRFRQTSDTVRFEVETESGDGQYRSVRERAYQLHFRGVLGTVTSVRLDGQEVPRVGAPEAGRTASWTTDDATGAIVVSLPRTSKRLFSVEVATRPGDAACAAHC